MPGILFDLDGTLLNTPEDLKISGANQFCHHPIDSPKAIGKLLEV